MFVLLGECGLRLDLLGQFEAFASWDVEEPFASSSPGKISFSGSHLSGRPSQRAMLPRWHKVATRCPFSTFMIGSFRDCHAIVEILHVVVALVDTDRIGRKRVFVESLRIALVTSANDRDFAFVSDEGCASSHPGIEGAQGQHHTVGILVVDDGLAAGRIPAISRFRSCRRRPSPSSRPGRPRPRPDRCCPSAEPTGPCSAHGSPN